MKVTNAYPLASVYGAVSFVGSRNGLGPNTVEIRTGKGYVETYGHMSEALVVEGMQIIPGMRVGVIGNLGGSYPIHLHVQMSKVPYVGPFIGVMP